MWIFYGPVWINLINSLYWKKKINMYFPKCQSFSSKIHIYRQQKKNYTIPISDLRLHNKNMINEQSAVNGAIGATPLVSVGRSCSGCSIKTQILLICNNPAACYLHVNMLAASQRNQVCRW